MNEDIKRLVEAAEDTRRQLELQSLAANTTVGLDAKMWDPEPLARSLRDALAAFTTKGMDHG